MHEGNEGDMKSVSTGSEKAANMGSCESLAGCQGDMESLSADKEKAAGMSGIAGMTGSKMEAGS